MNCPETTVSLGAYVLDALEPAERSAVEQHLMTCPVCAAERDELCRLPELLALVRPEDDLAVTPPADLYARVAAAASESEAAAAARPGGDPDAAPSYRGDRLGGARHSTRRRWLTSVAAGVVLLAGAGIGIGIGVTSGSSGAQDTVSAANGAVHIAVTAAAERTGTTLQVSVVGLPENEHCHLIAVATDGSRHAAGSWVATYAGRAQVTGSTTVPRDQLSRLVLLGTQHQPLVSVSL